MLVDAVPTLISTPPGGYLSDKYAARDASDTQSVSRLVPNTVVMLLFGPAGVRGTGWALHYDAHIAVVIAVVGVAGFGGYFYLPGVFSYITTVKQSVAASAVAGLRSTMTFGCGLVVLVGAVARTYLGYGWWLMILAALEFITTAVAYGVIVQEQRATVSAMQGLPIRGARGVGETCRVDGGEP